MKNVYQIIIWGVLFAWIVSCLFLAKKEKFIAAWIALGAGAMCMLWVGDVLLRV